MDASRPLGLNVPPQVPGQPPYRQASMADKSAWRQRSWTRNALAVVKIFLKQPWDQLKHIASKY